MNDISFKKIFGEKIKENLEKQKIFTEQITIGRVIAVTYF